MATKKKAKVRTAAQRSAAAKKAWQLRRLKEGQKPTSTKEKAIPVAFGFSGNEPAAYTREIAHITSPTSASATREGDDLFITISSNGSLFRHRVSYDTMRKLGLDALHLVG